MKRLLLLGVLAGAAVFGVKSAFEPSELEKYEAVAASLIAQGLAYLRSNPVPFAVALGTFLATVIYHKAKGKSLRESVEAAATRVTVVTMPGYDANEAPVIARARARATRTQLLTDQAGLQNRQRKLPEEIQKAEKDVCYTEQALKETQKTLALRQKAYEDAEAKLEELVEAREDGAGELVAIELELSKLATVV
ncbi:hypothetical protein BH11PLA2_BH11PLA2_11700 [soil metagenome]